jgi:hypothetical protein
MVESERLLPSTSMLLKRPSQRVPVRKWTRPLGKEKRCLRGLEEGAHVPHAGKKLLSERLGRSVVSVLAQLGRNAGQVDAAVIAIGHLHQAHELFIGGKIGRIRAARHLYQNVEMIGKHAEGHNAQTTATLEMQWCHLCQRPTPCKPHVLPVVRLGNAVSRPSR